MSGRKKSSEEFPVTVHATKTPGVYEVRLLTNHPHVAGLVGKQWKKAVDEWERNGRKIPKGAAS